MQIHKHKAPKILMTVLLVGTVFNNFAESATQRVVSGLHNPDSVAVGAAGTVYITEKGDVGKKGDGKISYIDAKHHLRTYVEGLDDPQGIVRWKRKLFVADRNRILRIDGNAPRPIVVARPLQFPELPTALTTMTLDSRGNLYVADMGDVKKTGKGAIYRVNSKNKVSLVTNEFMTPELKNPGAIMFERPGKLLVADFITGNLFRLDTTSKQVEKLASGFVGAYGLARGAFGTLYISTLNDGRVWKWDPGKPDVSPVQYTESFQSAGGINLSKTRKYILVPDAKAGTLTYLYKRTS